MASSSSKWRLHAGLLLSVVMVSLALWTIYRAAGTVVLADVIASAHALPASSIVLAFLLMAASYTLVTSYDLLALHHIARRVPYGRVVLASFLASAFGNNLGFSVVTGASVRYRIYSQAGLSAREIGEASLMCTATAVVGLTTVLAGRLVLGSTRLGDFLGRLPELVRETAGGLILAGIVAYIVLAAVQPGILSRGWTILRPPSSTTAAAQVLLGTLNVVLIGTLVYVLLPAPIGTSYLGYLGVFVLAMMGGGLSHVPGGIGVFESILLLGLPGASPAAVLGAALLFRCIYYLVPLSLATMLFVGHETVAQRVRILRAHDLATEWLSEFGPQLMAVLIAFCGVVLLFTGTLHGMHTQHMLLQEHVPLWLLETMHPLASLVGLSLVLLGPALSHRSRAARRAGLALLSIAILPAYLRSLHYAQPLTVLVALALLWPPAKEFRCPLSWRRVRFPSEWLSTIIVILLATLWLGIFNYRHMDYSVDLWWSFSYEGDYSRYLRSTLVLYLVAVFAIVRTTRAGQQRRSVNARQLEQVRRIIGQATDTRGQLALEGDKDLLFSASQQTFLVYRIRDQYWICFGAPVGERAEYRELVARFVELSHACGGQPAFYVENGSDPDMGLDASFEAAPVARTAYASLTTRLGDLRYVLSRRRLERQVGTDIRVAIELPDQAGSLHEELRRLTDRWSSAKIPVRARASYRPDYLQSLPVAVMRERERICGYAYFRTSSLAGEIALVQLCSEPGSSPANNARLILELARYGKAHGHRHLRLGEAPLSEVHENRSLPDSASDVREQTSAASCLRCCPEYCEGLFSLDWRSTALIYPRGSDRGQIVRIIDALSAPHK